jgi:hypothetical protein
MSPLRPMNRGWKFASHSSMASGVSRSGSTVTNTTSRSSWSTPAATSRRRWPRGGWGRCPGSSRSRRTAGSACRRSPREVVLVAVGVDSVTSGIVRPRSSGCRASRPRRARGRRSCRRCCWSPRRRPAPAPAAGAAAVAYGGSLREGVVDDVGQRDHLDVERDLAGALEAKDELEGTSLHDRLVRGHQHEVERARPELAPSRRRGSRPRRAPPSWPDPPRSPCGGSPPPRPRRWSRSTRVSAPSPSLEISTTTWEEPPLGSRRGRRRCRSGSPGAAAHEDERPAAQCGRARTEWSGHAGPREARGRWSPRAVRFRRARCGRRHAARDRRLPPRGAREGSALELTTDTMTVVLGLGLVALGALGATVTSRRVERSGRWTLLPLQLCPSASSSAPGPRWCAAGTCWVAIAAGAVVIPLVGRRWPLARGPAPPAAASDELAGATARGRGPAGLVAAAAVPHGGPGRAPSSPGPGGRLLRPAGLPARAGDPRRARGPRRRRRRGPGRRRRGPEAISEEVADVQERLARGLPLEDALEVGVVRLEVDVEVPDDRPAEPRSDSTTQPAPDDGTEDDDPEDGTSGDATDEGRRRRPPRRRRSRPPIPVRRAASGFVVVSDGGRRLRRHDPAAARRPPARRAGAHRHGVTVRIPGGTTSATVHSWDADADLLLLSASISNVDPLPWRPEDSRWGPATA